MATSRAEPSRSARALMLLVSVGVGLLLVGIALGMSGGLAMS